MLVWVGVGWSRVGWSGWDRMGWIGQIEERSWLARRWFEFGGAFVTVFVSTRLAFGYMDLILDLNCSRTGSGITGSVPRLA